MPIFILTESSDVSVCISPNGWAWLVHGRRLVIWRYTRGNLYSASSSGRSSFASVSANCRELTLPPSDLSHNAKLVNVFAVNENQTPSCIAVSPEGKYCTNELTGIFRVVYFFKKFCGNPYSRKIKNIYHFYRHYSLLAQYCA